MIMGEKVLIANFNFNFNYQLIISMEMEYFRIETNKPEDIIKTNERTP